MVVRYFPDEIELSLTIKSDIKKMIDLGQQLIKTVELPKHLPEKQTAILEELEDSEEAFLNQIQEALDHEQSELKEKTALATKTVEKSKTIFITLVVVLIVLCTILGSYIYKIIVTPIQILEKAANQIKSWNYDLNISLKNKNEFADLAQGFNDMAKAVKHSIEEKR